MNAPMEHDRPAAIARAFARRCPWCGGSGVFDSWFELKPACPTCGYRFEREEGYWVGAMVVIMGLIEIAFGALMLLGIALTYPDVPWTPLLAAGLALMVMVPVLGYPLAKLLWIAIDLLVHHRRGDIPDGAFTQPPFTERRQRGTGGGMSPYASSRMRTSTSSSYWEGPSRWINTVLLMIAGFIGLDALLRLLAANPDNGVVSFVRSVAGIFLAPFQNMFAEQQYLLTAIIAILGWALLAGLILAIVRNVGPDREVVHREDVVDGPVYEREVVERPVDPDPTRRL